MKYLMVSAALAFGLVIFSVALVMSATSLAFGYELSGHVSAEGRFFLNDGQFSDQDNSNGSVALAAEFYHEWESGSALTFAPFARFDNEDSERTHLDIREFNYLYTRGSWELRLGIVKVFWGTTEFVHLVDIVNQTDLVENIDGEVKLGQPMAQVALINDWGVIDIFVLPYFRERTFPGPEGRLRLNLEVDTDNPLYESSDEERHVDYALRYSHYIGALDFGVSYFRGTGREPTLLPGTGGGGQPVLVPFYELIDQAGLDLQIVWGQWLLKFEAIHRSGQSEDFFAHTGGFEYTLVGLGGSATDVGIVGEWARDDREKAATTPYDDDIMTAVRVTFNDAAGSEILAGLALDMNTSARIVSVEASRRFGSRIRASLEAYSFVDIPIGDPLHDLRDDDFIRLEVAWYF